jgi:hypothetical protein
VSVGWEQPRTGGTRGGRIGKVVRRGLGWGVRGGLGDGGGGGVRGWGGVGGRWEVLGALAQIWAL